MQREDGMKKDRYNDMPRSLRKNKYAFCYLMLAIALLHFIIFYVCVNINSILLAFQEIRFENWIEVRTYSLHNFQRFFQELGRSDTQIHIAVVNTLKYFAVSIFLMIPLTFLVSYFLFKKIWGYRFFRVVFFLPSIISQVVLVTMFTGLIQTAGPLYKLLEWFGCQMPPLLATPSTATNTILFYVVWTGFGVNMILYQGAMSRVPESVIEAGQLDGAHWYNELFQIITPMVWSTLSTTILLALTGIFTASGPILLFTRGGADTTTIAYWIYEQVYYQSSQNYDYAASVGVIFTLFSFPIVVLSRWGLGKIFADVEY